MLYFDGSTRYISLSDNDAWNIFGSDFTIAFWIRTPVVAQDKRLMGQYVSSSNFWQITWNGGNRCVINCYTSGSARFVYAMTWSGFTINEWHHWTIQRSGSSLLWYADGMSLSITTHIAWNGTTNIAAPLTIGQASNLTYGSGNFKDLMIWKGRALTQDEIKLLMNRTHPETGAGLMPANGDYYKLS